MLTFRKPRLALALIAFAGIGAGQRQRGQQPAARPARSPRRRRPPARRRTRPTARPVISRISRGQGTATPLAGTGVHRRVGQPPGARAAVLHPADDATGQPGRARRGHVREHRRVHPSVERRARRQSAADRRTRRSLINTRRARGQAPPAAAAERAGRGAAPAGGRQPADKAAADRRRRRPESPSPEKSRTTFRSPTRCCAIPIPATG